MDLIKLTKRFYNRVGKDFSQTRQSPWQGWTALLDLIKEHFEDSVSVVDLGCGNGRFYGFLRSNYPHKVKYTGYDTEPLFINEARQKYPEAKFENLDIIQNPNHISEKFNVITAFGLTHHIPGADKRIEWFEELLGLAEKKCLICLTFWDFKDIRSDLETIKTGPNDFLIGWNFDKAKRFAHFYTPPEILEIEELFAKKKFNLLNKFKSDGRSNNLNTYLIFGNM